MHVPQQPSSVQQPPGCHLTGPESQAPATAYEEYPTLLLSSCPGPRYPPFQYPHYSKATPSILLEKPGILQSMGSQRVGHDLVTEMN